MVLLNNFNYYGKSLDTIYDDISEFESNLKNVQNKKILKEINFKESIRINKGSFF